MYLKRTLLSLGALLCCLGSARADDVRRPYIVQLADPPLVAYAGTVTGLQATRPAAGKRLDLDAPAVQRYGAYLRQKQAAVRAAIAAAPVLYDYQIALNGFAVLLTDEEVRALKARGDVARISADAPRHLLTNHTPAFLGLDQPGGLWSQLGGPSRAGEDIVIGVIDTGAWPENPAYADRVDKAGKPTFDAAGTLAYGAAPAGWRGGCVTGEGWSASLCNNKLIGANYFNSVFTANGNALDWTEFDSARDSVGGAVGHGGHGTHTSTTAGGNGGVAAQVSGVGLGDVSGMAPRARLAVYKVCWTAGNPDGSTGDNGCYQGDTVAAVEQAIRDGVNVLSFSVSGGTGIDDPVDQAFLHAVDAGIFVAAAAGNEGPSISVNHVGPWLATVAATTHDRMMQSTLTLANGQRYKGASLTTTGLPRTPLIRAEDASVAGADPLLAPLCYAASDNDGRAVLDPAKVRGKIVVCRRGITARVDKSLAVQQAGGAGMVLVDDGNGLIAEVHAVPTVHVSTADGAYIAAYAIGNGAAGALSPFIVTRSDVPAPVVAEFSSRGPASADFGLMKPDLAAPGVDVLAGFTPGMDRDARDAIAAGSAAGLPEWSLLSGTSMATPHVAGLAALLRQRHPDWSPAAIKSALMTSAGPTLTDGRNDDAAGTLPWGQGAGQMAPNRAADPGLVYDLGAADYARYLCGQGVAAQCGGGALAGADLNLPSITLGAVPSTQTVQRTVTNVGATRATYTARASLPGFAVKVTPATLTVAPGESATFAVTATRTGAATRTWAYGELVWSDGSHTVRSPLQARASALLEAPPLLQSEQASGMSALKLATGFAGRMSATVGGMKAVTPGPVLAVGQARTGTVDTPEQIAAACRAGQPGVRLLPVTIAAGTVVARFEMFSRETGNPERDDLDLAMLDSAGKLVAVSRAQGADESVLLPSPAAGAYQLCVTGTWTADNRETTFRLWSSIVTAQDNDGSIKVMLPGKVYPNSYATAGISWSGLAPGGRYLGAVQFKDPGGTVGATTVLSIQTNDPVPLPDPLPKPRRAVRAL